MILLNDYKGATIADSLILKLEAKSTQLKTLAEASLANRVKADEVSSKIKSMRVNLAIGEKCLSRLKKNSERVERYLAKRKADGIVNIQTGMLAARAVIPLGERIKLMYEPNDVYLVGEDGLDINETDGSGFRATLSLFMRDRLLHSSDAMKFLLLDEPLSTLDLDNSAEISRHLGAMAINGSIVLIEQKPEIFLSADHVAYHFELVDGVSYVRKENVYVGTESV